MWGLSRKGCVVQKPVDNLTLSAEDGEALIARVHRSNLPRADAERVEWVIRMYFYVVFALREAKLSAKRLRSLLFGRCPARRVPPRGVGGGAALPGVRSGHPLCAARRGGDSHRRPCAAQCHALRVRKAALLSVRCNLYGRVALWRGERKIQRSGPGGAGGEPVLLGGARLSLARVPGDAGGAGARCDAVGPDRGGG